MRELNNFQTGFLLLVILALTTFAVGSNAGVTGMISSSQCGNDICESDESIGNCAVDCLHGCGDGVCDGAEEYVCQEDCTYAPTVVYFKLNTVVLWFSALVAFVVIIYWIRPIKETKQKKRRIRKRR